MNQRSTTGFDAKLGKRIRAARIQLGLSQSDVAGKLGISFQQLQKYERGANRISPERLTFVAQILETTVPHLMEPPDTGLSAAEDNALMDFMTTRDGVRLATAFMKLPKGSKRFAFLELVEVISE
jgi:transcriptional regulator with XRE-family HTH domain